MSKEYIYDRQYRAEGAKVKSKRVKGHDLIIYKGKELPEGSVMIGETSFKRIKPEKDVDRLVIGDRYYKLSHKEKEITEKTKGEFIKVSEEENIFVKINTPVVPFIVIFLLCAAIGVSVWHTKGNPDIPKKPTPGKEPGKEINIADGDNAENIPEESEEIDYNSYIELPYLSTITVKDNPVPLQNPENNTVYMGFKVFYDGEQIYETDGVVKPGEYIGWDAKEYFKEAGVYNLEIIVYTYDIEDQSDCTSATINSELTIK